MQGLHYNQYDSNESTKEPNGFHMYGETKTTKFIIGKNNEPETQFAYDGIPYNVNISQKKKDYAFDFDN